MSHSQDFSTRRPVDWPRAWRAIQVMRTDPERSDQVFELNVALDGGDTARLFQTFLAEPGARPLLDERPSLVDALSDRERLRSLPPDSLGRAYARQMDRAGYDADGLEQAAAQIPEFAELHPGEEGTWFARRGDCVHDLLHVVSGYGQDPAGETALLYFTDGLYGCHARMRVIRFGMVASLLSAPARSIPRALAFAIRARRRGARARIPFSYRWEDALARPLSEVRKELRVEPTAQAHPSGILRGGQKAPWSYGPAFS